MEELINNHEFNKIDKNNMHLIVIQNVCYSKSVIVIWKRN